MKASGQVIRTHSQASRAPGEVPEREYAWCEQDTGTQWSAVVSTLTVPSGAGTAWQSHCEGVGPYGLLLAPGKAWQLPFAPGLREATRVHKVS